MTGLPGWILLATAVYFTPITAALSISYYVMWRRERLRAGRAQVWERRDALYKVHYDNEGTDR